MPGMDLTDRNLLNIIQTKFPLVEQREELTRTWAIALG